MTPQWTDVLQGIGAIGSVLIAVIGFGILIYQVKQLERAIRGDTQSGLYTQSFEILKFLAENPDVRPYFYEGKVLKVGDEAYNLIMSATEIVADFFEHVVLQKPNLPANVWEKWSIQIMNTYSNSPTLQQYYASNKVAYCEDLLTLCESCKELDKPSE